MSGQIISNIQCELQTTVKDIYRSQRLFCQLFPESTLNCVELVLLGVWYDFSFFDLFGGKGKVSELKAFQI